MRDGSRRKRCNQLSTRLINHFSPSASASAATASVASASNSTVLSNAASQPVQFGSVMLWLWLWLWLWLCYAMFVFVCVTREIIWTLLMDMIHSVVIKWCIISKELLINNVICFRQKEHFMYTFITHHAYYIRKCIFCYRKIYGAISVWDFDTIFFYLKIIIKHFLFYKQWPLLYCCSSITLIIRQCNSIKLLSFYILLY